MADGLGFLGAALSGFGGGSVGGAVVHLLLDSRQFDAGLKSSEAKLTGASTSMGSRLKTLGPAIAAVGAAAAIGIGVKAVQAFNESEQAIAQTNAVLKSTGGVAGVTGGQVTKLASELQKLTTFSDEEVRSAENLLLTFTKIGSDIFPETTKAVLDTATALGKDLNSTAIMVGKALNDPIKGLLSLTRAGVQFTQQQKDQIKTLVESGKVTEAQTLILGELNTQMGGSAVAAGKTFAGQMKILANQLDDVLEVLGKFIVSLGKALLPVIKALVPLLKFAADHANLLLVAFAGFATVKWIIPFLATMTVKIQAVAGASLSAQVATSKWFASLGAASGPLAVLAAAIGGIIILEEHSTTAHQKEVERLVALGYEAKTAGGLIENTFNASMKEIPGDARSANMAVVEMIARLEDNAKQAKIAGKHSHDYADSLKDIDPAANRAVSGLRVLARAAGTTSKDFKGAVRESTNFVQARWEDLAGQAKVTATQIIRQFNRALRDQAKFAQNTREFADNVRESFNGRIPKAAQEMIADLAQRGTEGATIMAGLAGANETQIRRMIAQWRKGQEGPERYLGVLNNVGVHLDRLDGRQVVVDITARYHQVGAPPPGLAGFDQAVEDSINSAFVRAGG